jgi:aspartyl/asparaginyl beta-hydroxylase (cupin superfamily)
MSRLAHLLATSALVCIIAASFAVASDSNVDHCIDARAALRAGHFARAAELAAHADTGSDSTLRSSSIDCTALRGIALMRAQRIDEGAKVLDALVASMRRQQAQTDAGVRARGERPCRVVADYLGAAYELVARRLSAAAAASSNRAATPALAARATQQFHAALEMAVGAFQTADAFDAIGRPSENGSEQDDQTESCRRLAEFAQPPSFMYRSHGTSLQWLGRDAEARRVFARGASDARTGWASAWQRPLHAVPLVARALTDGPVYARDAHPALATLLATLEGELGAIRREFLAHMASSQTLQHLLRPEEAGLDRNGKWSALLLGANAQWDAASAACSADRPFPHTCALLRRLPLAQVANGQAKFSVMRAGVHVRPHAGPSNARLRVHCTLTLFHDAVGGDAVFRVGRIERVWRDDECFAFDEATEHEVSFRRHVGHAAETSTDAQSVAICADTQSAGSPFREMDVSNAAATRVRGEGDERRAAYRAVLIVDVANPFVAALDDFRRAAVSERGWRDHEAALRAAWAETKQ